MSFDLNAVDRVRAARIAPQRPDAPAPGREAGGFADALKQTADRVDAIPASPPPEVIDEMMAAQRAIEDMHARGRTLHFEMDAGRVKILLQDLEGNTLRRIPATEALEISTGKKVV